MHVCVSSKSTSAGMHWGEVLLRRNQEIEVSSFEILAGALADRPKLERDLRGLSLDVAKEIDISTLVT